MTEGIGLAGMLEEPIVVISVQRGGPSTGIPTKHEQGDLNQMLGAAHGEFARIVLAPKDVEDAFHISGRALNLAEKYQTPVLILSDLFLSEHFETAEPFKVKQPIDRGKLISKAAGDYKRFLITDDFVSPRLIPGAPGLMYCSPSDEHDEKGIVTSDVLAGLPESRELRNRLHLKRMKKLARIRQEDMRPPELLGPRDADLTLMGWGSTHDAIKEACEFFAQEGLKVNQLHFTDLFPLPIEKTIEILNSCKEIVAVENNLTGQMARLIRMETGYHVKRVVSRYDGEPFTGEDIYHRVKKELAYV